MAFLDNSGDIILDAVLTDTGRKRLARGDGSFNVAKFALGDDEINYGLYDKDHVSGSAYYDINILQTPVLEAFTNNTSTMKNKLITVSRTNLLYLPVIEMNTDSNHGNPVNSTYNVHVVAVDHDTADTLTTDASNFEFINGFQPDQSSNEIVFHQGLDTTELSAVATIDPDLKETQYIVHIDNRLGTICKSDGSLANYSFLDDDNIATYYFTETGNNSGYVSNAPQANPADSSPDLTSNISGPRGTKFIFRIKASQELESSTHLFTQFGLSTTPALGSPSANYRLLDSIIKVMGATTGYSVEIPVRYIKKV